MTGIFRGSGSTSTATQEFNIDGDKGDITVTNAGDTWTIDAGVVTTNKLGGDITSQGKALLDDATSSDQRTTLGLGSAAVASTTDFATAAQGVKADSAVQPADITNVLETSDIGVSVQAYDSDLTAWAGIATTDKQDTLVSAANIKTINGSSILGSGDLVVSSSIADGDKGDITVSSSGATWTIDNSVVTTAKLGGDITTAGKALLDDADASAQRTTLGLGSLATQSGTFSGTSSGTNTGDQNLFSTIVVAGQSNVVADTTSDSLTLVAGTNVTITTNATTDAITISANDTSVDWSEIQNKPDPTITLAGDLTGSVTLTDLTSGTLTATIAANSVALGTDTTGNYVASMTAGTGITVGTATGEGSTPVITNTAPDQVVSLTAGSNITVTGTYPSFTISSSGGGGGSMTYPSAGIALSTGTAWDTSITDNSSNWNTAYSWGNHASAGYLTSSSIGTTVQAYSSVLQNTTASFTMADETKLDGIASGAEVNVNADWNAVSGDAQILNKPTLGTAASTASTDYATAAQGAKADSALQPATIGVSVQAYDADTAKLDVVQSWTAQQTFKELKDTIHTITDGAAFEIDPANGSIQTVTLGANRTPAATNFEAGQVVLLGIDDGTAYTITWTTVAVTWVKAGGTASAPTLATTGFTWVLLWKVGSTIYGTEVGKP